MDRCVSRALLLALCLSAACTQHDDVVSRLRCLSDPRYDSVDIAFSIVDLTSGARIIHNAQGCKGRLTPCSTFKIANSLCGFDNGVLSTPLDTMRWDSVMREYAAWNSDLTVREAFHVSGVPHFQQLARSIGPQCMQAFLDTIDYGNRDITGGIDRFWLGSSLLISVDEQIGFLSRLASGTLPVSDDALKALREVMLVETKGDRRLYGKTGTKAGSTLGWYVGYVESPESTHVFVLRMTGESNATGARAKQLVLDIFKEMQLF